MTVARERHLPLGGVRQIHTGPQRHALSMPRACNSGDARVLVSLMNHYRTDQRQQLNRRTRVRDYGTFDA